MIHYLLLLRPVTFQHEPPPPPSSLYHYPHYYQQQHPKVNPTKPQKPHYQQRKQETQYSRLIFEQPSPSQSHVRNRASSYGTLQKCNCLVNSVSAESTSTQANKQAATGNSLYSYSTSKNQSNQWKASSSTVFEQEQQPHRLTSNRISSKKGKESQSLPTSNRTTESANSSRKLPSLSNHDEVESVTLQQTSQSSLPSKIRSIFHFQKRKRYSYSVSPRKILSSLRKFNFSRHTEFKKKVLREDIAEDDVREVATRKNFTKQIPTSESNHHQREKEKGKWKGTSSLLSTNCSSESNKSNITVVVETNKLVKRSITVKSSTTISSPSKPTTEKELDCCTVKSLNSNGTGGASVEEADHEQKKYSSCRPHEDDEENGNCSNINNNKRKNSSKKFEKLKKFLLFCKGLRKKSK